MKPEIKATWIAALRSGEYKQGRGALRNGNTFCCLGVLCDLHSKATGGEWDRYSYYADHDDTLPSVVCEWAGLDDNNPDLGEWAAAEWNDGDPLNDIRPHDFAEIAELIDQYL